MDKKQQIDLVMPKKKVDPRQLLEDALEILNTNQKNMMSRLDYSTKTLGKDDIAALVGVVRALATLKDVQLKEIELEKKLSELETAKLNKLSEAEFKEEILKIAEKIKEEETNEK